MKRGQLAFARMSGCNARDILKDTNTAITNFSTLFLGLPGEKFKGKLRRKIRRRVHFLVADAAKDEILSGTFAMFGETLLQESSSLFPNCKTVIRDKAHASRRLMSRPARKILKLRDVLAKFVMGKKAPARIIQESRVFELSTLV